MHIFDNDQATVGKNRQCSRLLDDFVRLEIFALKLRQVEVTVFRQDNSLAYGAQTFVDKEAFLAVEQNQPGDRAGLHSILQLLQRHN